MVLEDALVDVLRDALALLGRERLRVREVEAELVRADRRPAWRTWSPRTS